MRKNKLKKWMLFGIILFLLGTYTLLEPFWIQTVRLDISHPDIPKAFDGFTMVFLTDIHCGPFFSQQRVERLVQRVNRLAPDAVLIGGDNVHREDIRHLYSFYDQISKLKTKYGVYGVLGNHDYWMSEELSVQHMAKSNIYLLRNEGIWLEKGEACFYLGGVDDLMEGHPDVQSTIQHVPNSVFTMLLSHNPDVAELQPTHGVDWILSGHTHGGQVTLLGLWAPILSSAYGQKYRSGLIQKGDTSIYVSNGVGTITPPVRFFARPQIIVITLCPEE